MVLAEIIFFHSSFYNAVFWTVDENSSSTDTVFFAEKCSHRAKDVSASLAAPSERRMVVHKLSRTADPD